MHFARFFTLAGYYFTIDFSQYRKVLLEQIKRMKRKVLWGSLLLFLPIGVLLLNSVYPLPVEKLKPPSSTMILDRKGEILRVFLSENDTWQIDEPLLDQISPKLQSAVLVYEDRWFYQHPGINPLSIIQALITNIRSGRILRGGSTITMQLARMIEPKERTVMNKLIEMFRAVQIEIRFSKDEILTYYLNIAPYGGNIVGSTAASLIYFNKSQSHLSLGEASLLAAIPNSPTHLRPDINPTMAKEARTKVLRRMLTRRIISDQAFYEAMGEPVSSKRHRMPFNAPHVSRLLKQYYPNRDQIYSTIDSYMQNRSEQILRQYLAPLQKQDISNGSVVIMDAKTREVLTMVGSYDFFDRKNHGQVNGAVASRSPGSALKPFIYGIALNRGLVTPESLLNDVPVDYSGYRPVNYDRQNRGYVTVREALTESLNVPAINLCAKLGDNGIYSFLKQAGLTTLDKSKMHYGLSLILGSAEVRLIELTNLYASLADCGRIADYKLAKPQNKNDMPKRKRGECFESSQRSWDNQKHRTGKQIFSQEASFILSEILSDVRRPDLASSFEATANLPKVAWKTGTSYGHRDAWSIGYTPDLVIGVWVGNFDGHGTAGLVGSEVAAPILFAIFNAVIERNNARWFDRPNQVQTRRVCALSGMPKSGFCPKTKMDFYITGVSSPDICSTHKPVQIDNQTGMRLCSYCRLGRTYHEEIFEEWNPEIATWLNRSGYMIAKIPQHTPDCNGIISGSVPIIKSPSSETVHQIRSGIPLEYQKILLEASVSNRIKQIFWFLNGELVFRGNPSQKFFLEPIAGEHMLTCVDGEGKSASQTLTILD